jgi:MFS family permease
VGAVGLSAALLCLLLAVSEGAEWGWAGARTLTLFGATVVLLLAWGRWELRTTQPLVDLRVTARKQVLLTNAASAVFGFAMFAMSLVLPQVLQLPKATGYGLGTTMMTVGLVMCPSGLVMMAVAPLSARITRTRGPKVTLMSGATVVAAGYALSVGFMSAIWQLVLVSAVIGAGIGLAYGAMPALIMAAVPIAETAAANSFNTLMRSIGTSFASAVAGVVLSQLTRPLGPVMVPTQNSFRTVMAIGAGAALVALGVASALPARRPSAAPAPAASGAAATASAEG